MHSSGLEVTTAVRVNVSTQLKVTKPSPLCLVCIRMNMKPVIVSFDCIDHDPIDSWQPDDPGVVDFWMNFTIGTDQSAGDNFQVHIVTKEALAGAAPGKHSIVLDRYDWNSVLTEVECLLEQCSGANWDEISEKLSKHMHWEFENYVP